MARGPDRPGKEIGGPATSAAFLAAFGTLWMLGGLAFSGARPATYAAILTVGALLAGYAVRAFPHAARAATGRADLRRRAWFKWANILQYVGFAGIILGAGLARRPDLVPAGLSVVVALHFLPLAYVFDNPAQYVTAAAVLAWDVAAVARAPASSASGVSLGTGVILWAAASVQLARAYRRGRADPELLA